MTKTEVKPQAVQEKEQKLQKEQERPPQQEELGAEAAAHC